MYELDAVNFTIETKDGIKSLATNEFRLVNLFKSTGKQIVSKKFIASELDIFLKDVEPLIFAVRRKKCPVHSVNNQGWFWDENLEVLEPEVFVPNKRDGLVSDSKNKKTKSFLQDRKGFLKRMKDKGIIK
jgi:biotin operon repressor